MTDNEEQELRISCLSSLETFTKVFFELKTGRPFHTPSPPGRQSHYAILFSELENVFDLNTLRLIINIPPGHGKSTFLVYFVAWSLAHYPDSNYLYISYASHLAEKHTSTIKEVIEMPLYRRLFGVELKADSQAKGNFRTSAGGAVAAFGSTGSITGQDAGLPNLDRWSGCVIIDDPHKADAVHSDTMRNAVVDNYNTTIKPRPRGMNVPILFIGQRLHEADLADYLITRQDGHAWESVILQSLDGARNALAPHIISKEMLEIEEKFNSYNYWAQHQQKPQPAGGGIFKETDFHLLDSEPAIIETFITADTSETAETYNDATVFSFWGIHKITLPGGIDTGEHGLLWMDCQEVFIEPKDLESSFYAFYADCMRYKIKPKLVAVEKKSTGTTLVSTLKSVQGLRALEIERTKASGSKTARFLSVQPYVAKRQISFMRNAKHTKLCIEHCRKITANDTHRRDDICDTMYDAIKLALIDKLIIVGANKQDEVMMRMKQGFDQTMNARMQRGW